MWFEGSFTFFFANFFFFFLKRHYRIVLCFTEICTWAIRPWRPISEKQERRMALCPRGCTWCGSVLWFYTLLVLRFYTLLVLRFHTLLLLRFQTCLILKFYAFIQLRYCPVLILHWGFTLSLYVGFMLSLYFDLHCHPINCISFDKFTWFSW